MRKTFADFRMICFAKPVLRMLINDAGREVEGNQEESFFGCGGSFMVV
jgi:hypothetical protein